MSRPRLFRWRTGALACLNRREDRTGGAPVLHWTSFVVYITTCYLLPATLYPSGYVNDTLAFVTPNGNCIAVFGDIT